MHLKCIIKVFLDKLLLQPVENLFSFLKEEDLL